MGAGNLDYIAEPRKFLEGSPVVRGRCRAVAGGLGRFWRGLWPRGTLSRLKAMPRRAKIQRKTNETAIELTLDIDGKGDRRIATPVPFFNHMLEAVAKHGLFDLDINATGDVEVDPHHLVEDVGICLGQAFREALADMNGITRFGEAVIPMDETLVSAVVDFSGRAAFVYRADALKGRRGGAVDVGLGREVFGGLLRTAVWQLPPGGRFRGEAHPHIEAAF